MRTRADYVAGVMEFVAQELLDEDYDDLTPETPLLDWGVLDSRSVPWLLDFVEERYGIVVPDTEIHPRNFESVAAFAQMLERLEAGGPGDRAA